MDELEHPPLRIPLSSLKKRPSIQTVLRARGWLNLRETASYLGVSIYILKRLIPKVRGLSYSDIVVANGMYRICRRAIQALELVLQQEQEQQQEKVNARADTDTAT